MAPRAHPQPSTRRAYRADVGDFERWCAARGCRPLPADPADVAAFLGDRAGTLAPSTVARRLAAIVDAHRRAGADSPRDDPRVRAALASVQWHHRHRRRPTRALDVTSLARMSVAAGDSTAGCRDRAILLVGYAGALRRTELVALDVADVAPARGGGLRVGLARGAVLLPPARPRHLCPVRAWTRWQEAAGLVDGPAFRPVDRHGNVAPIRLSDRAVSSIVQRAAARAGLDPARYTGRSLRLGMVLAAVAAGASDDQIAAQTGHRTLRLVRQYRDTAPADLAAFAAP